MNNDAKDARPDSDFLQWKLKYWDYVARVRYTNPCELPDPDMKEARAAYDAARAALATHGMELLDPDMPAQELRLHMGEMTAQEERTARAAIRWANTTAQVQSDTKLNPSEREKKLVEALREYAEKYCGWECPVKWKTSEPQPHTDKCRDLRALLSAYENDSETGAKDA